MCASINLSQLRLSVRRLEQEIAEPCCREERMAAVIGPNTSRTASEVFVIGCRSGKVFQKRLSQKVPVPGGTMLAPSDRSARMLCTVRLRSMPHDH
ncbi:hypothetical protein O3P69_020049 [Scylla paramamosain]|uniref:Uncharacterized protein n=1 Tax=Scylla paramamosain TaxID=85552 RepID=A0AAW0TJH2_SCYPA